MIIEKILEKAKMIINKMIMCVKIYNNSKN